MNLPAGNAAEYVGTLTGQKVSVENGRINVTLHGNSGEIWVPACEMPEYTPVQIKETTSRPVIPVSEPTSEQAEAEETVTDISSAEEVSSVEETVQEASETAAVSASDENAEEKEPVKIDPNKSPEDMTVEELQASILSRMANNGPVTDQMKKTVYDNVWHDSLVNWLKSFH